MKDLTILPLCILLCAGAAAAQQPDSARIPLPAITVNALRSGVPLRLAPLGATLLGPERTAQAGPGVSLDEVLRAVPGLQLDNRHNQALGERLSIRGFGARAGFGIRGVRVLVDGVPATMPDGQTTLNHVDPARVIGAEVVRGAAAAFLGNAAGGAVLLRTGAVQGAWAEASAGAAGLWRLSAGTGAERLALYGTWQRQDGARAYNAWDRLLLGGTAALAAGAGRVELALHAVRYDAENPGALTAAQFAEDPTQASANNVRQQTAERGRHAQLGAGWILPLARYTVEVRAHGGLRSLDNPIPPRIIELERAFGGARAQLSRAGEHGSFLLGGEAEVQSDDRVNYENEAGTRGALTLAQDERVRTLAVFTQAQWIPREDVRLFGALRADRYRFAVTDRRLADGDDSGARVLAATSATAGASLLPLPALELFANVGTAFETPTTTELANSPDGSGGFHPTLEPERTLSFEAGLRTRGARGTLEFAAFRAAVRDKLIPFELASQPGRQFYRNAGHARHQGVELAAELRPRAWLALWGAWTRLDARFREYVVDSVDYAGRRIPGAAAHQLELGGSVRWWQQARVRLDVRRTGRVAATDANDAAAEPYTLVHARASWHGLRLGNVRADVYAGADNLLDRAYAAAVSVNAFGGRYFEPGPARSFYTGLRLTLR